MENLLFLIANKYNWCTMKLFICIMMIVVKVCKFPCSSTTKLLIAAGADPQVIHLITPPPISNHTLNFK